MDPVLKTGGRKRPVGSNPTPSARLRPTLPGQTRFSLVSDRFDGAQWTPNGHDRWRTVVDRYRNEGEAGLRDRSSRPHSSPSKTSPEAEAEVLRVRAAERVGRDEVADKTEVPARTVSRILARHGVPRLAMLDPMTGELLRSSKSTAIRYERDRPGELVHVDVKKLGKIPDGGGWKALGREHAPRDRKTTVSYGYVHSLVDDHSRLAYSEVLEDEKGPTCAGFLERAIAYFAAHGVTTIERLITDSAWAYRFSLRSVCADHSIRQTFIKPHCPWQTGTVERLNRTLATEWAYRRAYDATKPAETPLRPGSCTTTLNDATPPSEATRPPAA